jgi:DNA-binding NtrC family response regulator
MQTQKLEIQFPRPMAHEGYLHFKNGSSRETREIGAGLSIGRDSCCQFQIEDEFASLRHCRIERKPQGFFLRDLRSRNGTFLNGTPVLEAQLYDGDRIQAGRTLMYFRFQRDPGESQLVLESANAAWNLQLSRLNSIAESELSVLLLGNSGTGKELLAEQIHRKSGRRQAPFVSVNCSALGESLVESELFGHTRGSFTGATHDRKGAFETARGGTLFLDEVGDLPPALQPKLLRALENSEIRPVGSDRVIKTDVRIVAATHANLKSKVLEGQFRADLYYRLHGVQLTPPDLTDRMEDFERLFYHFAKMYKVRFSFAALQELKKHSWPGNVRELKNAVARSRALFPHADIEVEHLTEILDQLPSRAKEEMYENLPGPREGSLFKELEKRLIVERLSAHQGNQRRVAEDLGMPKSTLNDRIHLYQIDPRKFKA